MIAPKRHVPSGYYSNYSVPEDLSVDSVITGLIKAKRFKPSSTIIFPKYQLKMEPRTLHSVDQHDQTRVWYLLLRSEAG